MIEDKKLGLKVAESKEEAFLTNLKEKMIEENMMSRHTIEFNEILIKHIERRLKNVTENL